MEVRHKRYSPRSIVWSQEVEEGETEVILRGGEFIVPSCEFSAFLYEELHYGHHLWEEREEFQGRLREELFATIDERTTWACKSLVDRRLRLSAEEVFYLITEDHRVFMTDDGSILSPSNLWSLLSSLSSPHFFYRYVVYRFLRHSGWIVRPGLPFGCDYLIYGGSPDETHASAGIVVGEKDEMHLDGLVRTLGTTKKSLIVTKVKSEGEEMDDVEKATVQTRIMGRVFITTMTK